MAICMKWEGSNMAMFGATGKIYASSKVNPPHIFNQFENVFTIKAKYLR